MKLQLLAVLMSLAICTLAQQRAIIEYSELIFRDPPFAQCHASTVIEIGEDRLMAAWFGGSHEGAADVCIWLAQTESGNWQQPRMVATGIQSDSISYPCWNPVLFRPGAGKLLLFYKVGPSPQSWWGMVITSTDDGNTWSVPNRLPPGIIGPVKNKPISLGNAVILSGSSTETKEHWRVHMERSVDDGASWTIIPVDTASSYDVIQPSILTYADGRLQILCRSKQGRVVQAWSNDSGKSWSRLSATPILNPNSGTDAVTLKDGRQLIVYNPDLPGKEWYNGRSRLRVAISTDGRQWKDIATLENGTSGEFSYPAVIQGSDERIHITYTYDRKNIKHVVLRLPRARRR